MMIDFDDVPEWEPSLSARLSEVVSSSVRERVRDASPKYIEDARRLLLQFADRDEVIDATLSWIESSIIYGYHGTRLTDEELAAVRTVGLVPLRAHDRRGRLKRALSSHPRWRDVAERLESVLQIHGAGERAGRREHQVHLTLSRNSLASGFNHYITHGSEFDQHVAHAILGPEGMELLRQDGKPRILKVAVPGADAINAAHPHFTVENLRHQGDVPNIVSELLEAWAYRMAHPGFQSRSLAVDCGMVFRAALPAEWIVDVETLPV